MLSFLFLHTHWEPGKPIQQVCSFVLKFKKTPNCMIFRAINHEREREMEREMEREGGEIEGEKFT